MACVTVSKIVYGFFSTSGPVSGWATDGVHPVSQSKGPSSVPVGSTLAADAQIPAGVGSTAWGHGDVNVKNGYATLTAKACSDGLAGHSAQGSAQQGTVVVTASPYTVQFQYRTIRFTRGESDMFLQLRIVQLNPGEFDPRSYPGDPANPEPDSPLAKALKYLKPIYPSADNLLLVQQFTVDSNGALTIETEGSAVNAGVILTPKNNFKQSGNGNWALSPMGNDPLEITVDRPRGEYYVRFQVTWGVGVLPQSPMC